MCERRLTVILSAIWHLAGLTAGRDRAEHTAIEPAGVFAMPGADSGAARVAPTLHCRCHQVRGWLSPSVPAA